MLERFHAQGTSAGDEAGSLNRLMALFSAAWRRSGFGESDDELQFRERAIDLAAPLPRARVLERRQPEVGRAQVRLPDRASTTCAAASTAWTSCREGGYELIDYKTGDPKPKRELETDVQLAIYRLAARESWKLDGAAGSYWYVLADEKVAVGSSPDDLERVEGTVLEVGEGILGQDFEPRPSPVICAWCDFKLICPASRRRPHEASQRSRDASPAGRAAASRRGSGRFVASLAQEALEVLGQRLA